MTKSSTSTSSIEKGTVFFESKEATSTDSSVMSSLERKVTSAAAQTSSFWKTMSELPSVILSPSLRRWREMIWPLTSTACLAPKSRISYPSSFWMILAWTRETKGSMTVMSLARLLPIVVTSLARTKLLTWESSCFSMICATGIVLFFHIPQSLITVNLH